MKIQENFFCGEKGKRDKIKIQFSILQLIHIQVSNFSFLLIIITLKKQIFWETDCPSKRD